MRIGSKKKIRLVEKIGHLKIIQWFLKRRKELLTSKV